MALRWGQAANIRLLNSLVRVNYRNIYKDGSVMNSKYPNIPTVRVIIFSFSWGYAIFSAWCLLLPWHRLHLRIWYWRTSSCFQCWSQSDGRLSEPCPLSRPWFGLTPPRSVVTWRLPGGHGSGWGPGRPSPCFSLPTLLLLGVCHILGMREEGKLGISEMRTIEF